MSNAFDPQIALLRQQHDATSDLILRDALLSAITVLESAPPHAIQLVRDVSTDANPLANERNITTNGGMYVEGHADLRQGSFYEALVQVFYQAAGTPDPTAEQREVVVSYLDGLIGRCDRMRLAGMVDWERKHGKAPAFTLSQLYVALASTAWQTVAEAESVDEFTNAVQAGHPDTVLPWCARRVIAAGHMDGIGLARGLGEVPRARLERPILITEALSRQHHIVLLGGPGSGKSTFLRHLAVALARAEQQSTPINTLPGWDAGLVLPIYASLGAYAAWTSGHPERLTLDELWHFLLSQSEGFMLEGLTSQFMVAFRKHRLLLLLDGLDEVADPTLRTQVAAVVARLSETQGYVAVTCRVRSFEGPVAVPFAAWGDPVQLAPFTLGQIRHFVRGWYQRGVEQRAITAALAEQRAGELSERIAVLKELRELAEMPLLLTIITILHYYEGKLPDDRADLYEDMAQLLLTRWTAQRREAGVGPSLIEQLRILEPRLGGLSDYQIRSVLESLAYRAHQAERAPNGRGLLERGIVREAFIKLFANFNLDDGIAGTCAALVLRYLEEESGLLLHEGGDLYGLPHLTYEEYLASCYMAKQKGKPNFQALAYQHWRADPGRWREVIFLALGRMVRGDDRDIAAGWLDFLLMQSHGTRIRDPLELQQTALFAGDCLHELGGKTKLSDATIVDLGLLWQHLAKQLAEVVEGTLLPAAERVRAGVLLGALGDLRPGVCDLPPRMVAIDGGKIVLGLLHKEVEPFAQQFFAEYQVAGNQLDDTTQQELSDYFQGWVNDQPQRVASFELARYVLTNAQFARFIAANGYDASQPWWDAAARAWLARNDAATCDLETYQKRQHKDRPEWWHDQHYGSARPNHPVVGISWYEATAFATWLTLYLNDGYSYYLPSELEWEYAARGTKRSMYAWGNSKPDAERVNFDQIYNGTTTVGCFSSGATPHGLLDLAGNVWEWTRSAYCSYPYDPADGREDPSEPAKKRFTLRGGGWDNLSINLRASDRDDGAPDNRAYNVGVRLARRKKESAG